MLTGVARDDLIQLGPGRVSTAQLAFRVFLSRPSNDRLPANTPHIYVHESNVANGAGSKGCVLAALLTAPGGFLSVNEALRSRSLNVLVGDNPGDLLRTAVKNAFDTLFKGGEDHLGREDDSVPLPERRSRREWRKAGVGETRGRCGNALFSDPRRGVRRDSVDARGGIRVSLFLFSANSPLDQAIDDFDGLSTDFDRLAAYHVGLGQSRTCPWVTDDNPVMRGRRSGRRGTGGRSGSRMRIGWGEEGGGRGSVRFGVGNVVLGRVAHSSN